MAGGGVQRINSAGIFTKCHYYPHENFGIHMYIKDATLFAAKNLSSAYLKQGHRSEQ